ncbi:alpha-L-fucosidase-like [Ornithodoros turicata]|uniref:alpha-L-fucosidase-like n=1 Tax=Ornithodoros turicata TaxID=34597 RepID=UPI00313A24E3
MASHMYHHKYKADWTSLDSRPLPGWYDDAKIGIFIHWGVYSVPAFENEWFWHSLKSGEAHFTHFMKRNFKPDFTYQEFAPMFTAEFFDPQHWVKLFTAAGARYVVLTAKHHDGYALWPSKFSANWNAVEVGPHRDIVGELATAIRKTSPLLRFGVSYSLMEWFHPLYLSDKKTGSKVFVTNKIRPELTELVDTYKPEVIWAINDWEDGDKYSDIVSWLYNDSLVRDTVVVNDRWAKGTRRKHGDFWTSDSRFDHATLVAHKWENGAPMDRYSYGYRRNASLQDYLSIEEILRLLAETISTRGNLLINVGPSKDGTIPPLFEERLLQLGDWLKVNGEAVYSSRPWKVQNDPLTSYVWYTSSKDGKVVYAFVLRWPTGCVLTLGGVQVEHGSSVSMLGVEGTLEWEAMSDRTVVHFPELTVDLLPCRWAWVLKVVRKTPCY